MKVYQLEVGNMQNFTYVVQDEETDEAVIIDPSWDLDQLIEVIQKNNLKVKYIINTHHHFDHTVGNDAMAMQTGSKIIQHTASTLRSDIRVSDGDKISFGNSELTVIHTPVIPKTAYALSVTENFFQAILFLSVIVAE